MLEEHSSLTPGHSPAGGPEKIASSQSAKTITLSLISHTNVGKTALARTLLRRDVGEVRDAPHITDIAEAHEMISTPEGDRLLLWDTPGFGDSARLLRRLKASANPVGWFLSAVWDRFTDRPFWCSQQAVKNVRDDADIVLYLVNAAEAPADAGYIDPEMEMLGWLGKPIVVVLNQLGAPRERDALAAEEAAWRSRFSSHPLVEDVAPLDAFGRCWVQEDRLLETLTTLVPQEKRDAYARVKAAWTARNEATFSAAMQVLARFLARAARDRETLTAEKGGIVDTVTRAVGMGRKEAQRSEKSAARKLAQRLDEIIRSSTDELAVLYGLESKAGGEILQELSKHIAAARPMDEGRASLVGSVVTGALSGLAADIATGGLTFGAAMIAGAVAGAVGGRLLAREVNKVQGEQTELTWSEAFLAELTRQALLRYLAVAHYGRARGAFVELTRPAHWTAAVAASFPDPDYELTQAIDGARSRDQSPAFATLLTRRARAAFAQLYPPA